MPCIGRRLQLFAARNPTMPHGPYAGESIFDPMPLHPAPPGLPTMPNGSVDICALIPPQTTTKHRTRAGRLAGRITNWAGHSLTSDGRQYEAQSADGIVRAFPMPPGQMPRWHGPANLMQPVNSVPMGQACAAPPLPALSLTNISLTPCPRHPRLNRSTSYSPLRREICIAETQYAGNPWMLGRLKGHTMPCASPESRTTSSTTACAGLQPQKTISGLNSPVPCARTREKFDRTV
jgi:hypothetical protein